MNYYLIAGVGFSEMRTAAMKLKAKLVALHGVNAVESKSHGAIRHWSHNAEAPHSGFVTPDGGLGSWGTKVVAALEANTEVEHFIGFGPGILLNLDKIVNFVTAESTKNLPKMSASSNNVNAYLLKTNDTSSTLVTELKADWDRVDKVLEGTGIVNPTAEEIQTAKDSYMTWAASFVNTATTLFSDIDEWNAWGGWNNDCTPTATGAGVTDVTSATREDGTTANFTNNPAQYYIAEY